jgi:quercetin dioxygenase-like cupin family protein
MPYHIDLSSLKPKGVGPGMQIRVASGERIMLSYVDLKEGSEVKDHSHVHEQAGIVIEGEGDFRIGEERKGTSISSLLRWSIGCWSRRVR